MFQSPPQECYSYQVCISAYECDPSVVNLYDSDFWVLLQNFEKQQLPLCCLSVGPLGTTQLPLDGFSCSLIIVFCFFFFYLLTKFKFREYIAGITGTLHDDQYLFLIISRSFLLRMKNVSGKSCRENQNTHFLFNNVLY